MGGVTSSERPLLEVRGASKTFGGVTRALHNVDLTLYSGQVVALVGENGAGKSTLGKVISGVYPLDSGELIWCGQRKSFSSTVEALSVGISIVMQEFNLIPEMTVAENIFLSRKDGYRGWWKRSHGQPKAAIAAMSRLGLDFGLDPNQKVEELSVAQQQLVEIVRAISHDAKLFILDEPTAALGKAETQALLDIVRELKSNGASVVIVTHRLDEVFSVADRIVVLRDGEIRREFDPDQTTEKELINAMVGRELAQELRDLDRERKIGETVLEVRELSNHAVTDCSFTVQSGEIVGIAGLVGSGRTELVRAIFGVDKARGTVAIGGQVRSFDAPIKAIRGGAALVPEDRKAQGLHLDQSIYDNAVLSRLAQSSAFVVSHRKLRKEVQTKVSELGIRLAGLDREVSSLSGGNQQKVVLTKWLLTNPKLLILDEPTRGIDVGARAEFYRLVDDLVSDGMAVLLISSELPEVLALSDRILVMSQGRIVKELHAHEATEETILSFTDIASETQRRAS